MVVGPAYGADFSGEYVFTGNVEFPNGTAAAPSIRGVSDLDTGIAWLGSDVLIASTGGTAIVRVETSGLTIDPSGTSVTPECALDVIDSSFPQVLLASNTTDSTIKGGMVASRHYLNAEQHVSAVYMNCGSGFNTLNIGGGNGSLNAATNINFYAASSYTALSGTNIMRMTSSGLRIEDGISGAATYLFELGSTTYANGLTFDKSTGNVGVGAVPNASHRVDLYSSSGATSLRIRANANSAYTTYSDSSQTWLCGVSGAATFFVQDATSSNNRWICNITNGNHDFAAYGAANAQTAAAVRVRANSATAAVPVLEIDQGDADQAFVNYTGTSAASAANSISSWTAGNSIQGFVRVEINGTTYWMPYYNAPTS